MKFSFSIALVVLYALVHTACDDIIEKDITKGVVQLILPADSLSTTTKSVNFWWNELEGARSYHLVVTSPNLQQPKLLLIDTVIKKNKFTLALDTGNFQWCVRGENDAYKTSYSCRLLTIKN